METKPEVIPYESPPAPVAMVDDHRRHRRDSVILVVFGLVICVAAVAFPSEARLLAIIGGTFVLLGIACLLVARARRRSKLLQKIF